MLKEKRSFLGFEDECLRIASRRLVVCSDFTHNVYDDSAVTERLRVNRDDGPLNLLQIQFLELFQDFLCASKLLALEGEK